MRPRIHPDKKYSTPQAARLIGASPRSLETWRRCGTHPLLVWRRVKHKIVYRGADLLTFLSSQDPVGNFVDTNAKRRRGVR
jgi:hypothetical protein